MLRTAALLSLSATLASCQYATAAPTAQVKNGSYVGLHSTEYNQDYFLGIPFAQPPVGNLRYRNPVGLNQSWTDVRPATEYSTECYGYGSDQWNYPVSEDCLYLNVIRPAGYENQSLPVAFWIHGGGFSEGGGIDQRYNTSFMVQNSVKIGKPIIAVNINYRLSAWGFLSGSEELVEEGTLNLGLRDQRLALQWVQENVAAFGGNPEQVTIYGESAGAASVGFHLTAYNGRDDKLFRGAIMQSGNPINFGPLKDPLANADMYKELTRRTNCVNQTSPLECLRLLPAEQLNAAINTTQGVTLNVTGFMPILDGDFIAKRTSLQLEAGEFVHVPIIDGANSDEGSAFSPSPVNGTEAFRALLKASGNGNLPDAFVDELLAAYPDDLSVNVIASLGNQRPPPQFGAQFRRSASYFGDQAFIAPRRRTCETWAAAGLSAYCYRFNAIPAGIPPFIGATHFQEVAFVFLNLEGVGYVPAAVPPFTNKTESYRNLARFMDSNWVSFVHDLDPNSWRQTYSWAGNEALWPKYSLANPMDMVFDANVSSYAEPDTYRKGEAVEQEASNFVNGIASVALSSATGKHPQGEPPEGDAQEKSVPDPTRIAVGAADAKDVTAGATPSKHHDKTKVPMETAMWSKMRPVMHVLADVTDTWERFANLLDPTPPFPRNKYHYRLAAVVAPLLLISLFVTSYMFMKGVTFGVGFGFFGNPIIVRGLDFLNRKVPNWQKLLELRNTLLKGVPTNAQLTITLLRIGEANKAPLPPPPHVSGPPPEKPVDVSEQELRATGADWPLNATQQELDEAMAHDPNTAHETGGEDIDKAKNSNHGGKKGNKIVNFFRGATKGGVQTVIGADKLKAATGSHHAKNRLGAVPSKNADLTSGPVEFKSRFNGKKGHLYITTKATIPCIAFSTDSTIEKIGTADREDLHPLWSVPVGDIKELRKVGGYGWKAKMVVGWAMGREVADGIIITDRKGDETRLTAMPLRDELFNRLVAMGGQKWECW